MTQGKLIIIEGSDGSGKATQSRKLMERMAAEGFDVQGVTFPDYDSPSSALIKMYLGGDFGEQADSVSPYIASTFYTADRYASFKMGWETFYQSGGIIISDRYTTSNMVHQGAKIDDSTERQTFFDWLADYEYRMFGLPEPDCVIFLDVSPSVSQAWTVNRKSKMDGTEEQDIHERDRSHLERAYDTACEVSERFGWQRISAVEDGEILGINEIHERVWESVKRILSHGGQQ